MLDKKISVIVPIYNTEQYLERCVDSILAQTYTNLEIILVDDGSKDSSPEICDRYGQTDNRVKVVHKQNGGLSSARNAGLDVATGDYVGFVDSDDYISKEMYAVLANALNESDCEISNAMYVRVDEFGNTRPSKVPHDADKEILSEQFVRELMLHTGDVSVCTKLFKTELFDGLRFPEGKLNEDLLFMLKVFETVQRVAFVAHKGYFYFTRSGSTSSGYGKAVIDMVGNSLEAKKTVDAAFPGLKRETKRFALYQHMAFLLLVPPRDAYKGNDVYVGALKYLRKHFLVGMFNRYLTPKNKITIAFVAVAPRLAAKYYQKKS